MWQKILAHQWHSAAIRMESHSVPLCCQLYVEYGGSTTSLGHFIRLHHNQACQSNVFTLSKSFQCTKVERTASKMRMCILG